MLVLTAEEMGATDRRTATEYGVPLRDLMEQAGTSVARFCVRQYPAATRMVVLCGKGNNGGDGLVAARVLAGLGRQVDVLLLGERSALRGDAAWAMEQLQQASAAVAVQEAADEAVIAAALAQADLVVDAVVGTGFRPPLRGVAVAARHLLERTTVPVVAVDLPSGWDADSMDRVQPGAFRADSVVTFTAPKLAHIFGCLTGRALAPVVVAQIGSPQAAVQGASGLRWTGSAKQIVESPRAVEANKGRFGHVLVVGGSEGKAGAPAMASLAALRCGAGLVTAAVPRSVQGTVAAIAPELMVTGLAEDAAGSVSLACFEPERLGRLLERRSVVALGPGLSTEGDAPECVRRLVQATAVPMVLDADALNAYAGRAHELDGRGRVLVLTPHPGEMARLLGVTVAAVEADRVSLARGFAQRHHVTLVLKGWRTLVAHPDGTVAVNTSGNPAMAKGGSGDVLTGMVAALLAQYGAQDAARAVEAAVYLHGLAADLCVRDGTDEHCLLATDGIARLSDAFRYRVRDADGLTWLCGVQGRQV
ncbi:MAG: NAD(P)H-hydrate dehydratase [Acidobacteriota bacterium]|nr:NAD(P)H-hydrate dehydratase [Acidobacteriota bacterium]